MSVLTIDVSDRDAILLKITKDEKQLAHLLTRLPQLAPQFCDFRGAENAKYLFSIGGIEELHV